MILDARRIATILLQRLLLLAAVILNLNPVLWLFRCEPINFTLLSHFPSHLNPHVLMTMFMGCAGRSSVDTDANRVSDTLTSIMKESKTTIASAQDVGVSLIMGERDKGQ